MIETEKLIDGKAVAKTIRRRVAEEIEGFAAEQRKPRLDVVLVGDDPASHTYVRSKARACKECGIEARVHERPAEISQESLLSLVGELSGDDRVDGVLVQLPLPGHLDEDAVIRSLDPSKDVDGLHPESLGLLAAGKPRLTPCTPRGIQILLEESGIDPAGREIVILGRSLIVGRSLSLLLSLKGPGGNATVTVCHSRTRDVSSHTRRAEILVAAVGSPGAVTGDMVSDGVVVIDVGVNRVEDPSARRGYRLVGDVEFESVAPKASRITPVPGGVGPMTVAVLMQNTLRAYRARREAET
jgi:methylenetetrahydrofolate dehydrogenase (NADP+)/methenyltetrahydrofolate cyclohydrolase